MNVKLHAPKPVKIHRNHQIKRFGFGSERNFDKDASNLDFSLQITNFEEFLSEINSNKSNEEILSILDGKEHNIDNLIINKITSNVYRNTVCRYGEERPKRPSNPIYKSFEQISVFSYTE